MGTAGEEYRDDVVKEAKKLLDEYEEDMLGGEARAWLELLASEAPKMTSSSTGCAWRVSQSGPWVREGGTCNARRAAPSN